MPEARAPSPILRNGAATRASSKTFARAPPASPPSASRAAAAAFTAPARILAPHHELGLGGLEHLPRLEAREAGPAALGKPFHDHDIRAGGIPGDGQGFLFHAALEVPERILRGQVRRGIVHPHADLATLLRH